MDDLLTYLGEVIESARVALEECLRGYDSFDTLAFLSVLVVSRFDSNSAMSSRITGAAATQVPVEFDVGAVLGGLIGALIGAGGILLQQHLATRGQTKQTRERRNTESALQVIDSLNEIGSRLSITDGAGVLDYLEQMEVRERVMRIKSGAVQLIDDELVREVVGLVCGYLDRLSTLRASQVKYDWAVLPGVGRVGSALVQGASDLVAAYVRADDYRPHLRQVLTPMRQIAEVVVAQEGQASVVKGRVAAAV